MRTSATAKRRPSRLKLIAALLCLGPRCWWQLRPRKSHDVRRRPKSATVRIPAPVLVHRAFAIPARLRADSKPGTSRRYAARVTVRTGAVCPARRRAQSAWGRQTARAGPATFRMRCRSKLAPAGPPSILHDHDSSSTSHTCTTDRECIAHRTCRAEGDHATASILSMHEKMLQTSSDSQSRITQRTSTAHATYLPSGENAGRGPAYLYASLKSMPAIHVLARC